MTITATLKMARFGDRGTYIGVIYGDIRKRWPDGTLIKTSRVMSRIGNTITTQNSIYEVEMADEVSANA